MTEPSSRLIYPSYIHFLSKSEPMTAFSHKLLMQELGNAWCEAKWIFLKEQEYTNAQRRRVNHQTKLGLFMSITNTQAHFAPTNRFNENNEHLPKAISWLILWKRYERKYFYLRVFFVFFVNRWTKFHLLKNCYCTLLVGFRGSRINFFFILFVASTTQPLNVRRIHT